MGLVKQVPHIRECLSHHSRENVRRRLWVRGEACGGGGGGVSELRLLPNVQLLGNKMGKQERPQMASAGAFRPPSNTIKV